MANIQDIDALIKEIAGGKPASVYLFHGDQDFLVKQAYDRVLEALVPESERSFNLEQMDGSRCEIMDLIQSLETLPMIPGPKAIGVSECRFFLSKNSAAELLEKARERWELKDVTGSLRHLGKVLALASHDFASAAGLDLNGLAESLSTELDAQRLGGEWLGLALAQGLASGASMPQSVDDGQTLNDYLENGPPEGVFLVMAAPSADARKRLYKMIQQRGKVLDFKAAEKPQENQATAGVFMKSLLAQRGLSMELSASQRMVAAYGHDLGLMARELDKMAAHAHPRTQLAGLDLEAVGSPRAEEEVWVLLRALGEGERKAAQALATLHQQLAQQRPEMLFAVLSNEMRGLYLARCLMEENLVPRNLGNFGDFRAVSLPKLLSNVPEGLRAGLKKKNPYALFQSLTRCKEFSLEHLAACVRHLAAAERAMKTGQGEPVELLETLILKICGLKEDVWV
jgi:DNA polymerase-3 subunit delta